MDTKRDEEIYQKGVEHFNAKRRHHYRFAIEEWEKIPHYQPARTALAMCHILGVGRPLPEYGFPVRSQEKLMELIGITDDVPALMRELINAYSGVLPYDWSRAMQGMKSSAKRGGDTVVPCIAAYCALEKPYPKFDHMMTEDRALGMLEEMAVSGYPLATRILFSWIRKCELSGREVNVDVERIRNATRKREEATAEEKSFLENAFLFYSATERILADEKLRFVVTPFSNHLAYTGRSGFRGATLGTYVTWWQRYKAALSFEVANSSGEMAIEPRLLYHIAGSPLSGSNVCAAVCPKGSSHRRSVCPFTDAWRSFMDANRTNSVDDEEHRRSSYSIRDAVRILRADPDVMAHYEQVMRNLASGKRYDTKLPSKKSKAESKMMTAAEFFGEPNEKKGE